MLVTLLCVAVSAAVVMATLFPETPIGGRLRALLIEWPARKLSAVKRTQIVFGLLFAMAVVALIKLGSPEATAVFGQALTEGGVWFITFDIATYLDAFLLLTLIAAMTPMRAVWQAVRTAGARARQWALGLAGRLAAARVVSSRSRSARSRASSDRQAEDDDGATGLTYGFAC